MKSLIRLALALLLFWATQPFAQAQLTETDTLPVGYRFGLQGNYLRGNVDRLLLMAQADLSLVGDHVAFRSANTYQFGTFGPVRTENDLLARQFLYAIPDQKAYPYVMIWLESNQRRQMAWRYQVGPGVTLRLLDKKDQQLKGSVTLTHENAQFRSDTFSDTAYSGQNNMPLWRGTLRIAGHHLIGKGQVRLRYEGWFQPAFSDLQNWRLHNQAALQIKVWKQLSFQASLQYNRESVVVEGVKNGDLMALFGISLGNMP
ncbi:MAG: DUF481 domain-containing protein [Bacteroidetes bacterium]|nr:DUF481 domain-containing protein [Bacteroidota bacterium]